MIDNLRNCSDDVTEPSGPPLGQATTLPEHFGPFKILDLIHESNMSVVYKAKQQHPERFVVLKVPRNGRLCSEETRAKFESEYRLASKVCVGSIVPVLEGGEIDNVPYYTMPFVEGRSLKDHVEMESLDICQRLDLFNRLCELVQKLHDKNLVHLDLKPGNVMVDRTGDVWLLDFGLTKSLKEVAKGAFGGTPPYMAPEQTHQDRPITLATDVHALGVILFQLLTDRAPFPIENIESNRENRERIFGLIQTCRPKAPSIHKPHLPDRYDSIVLACLEKVPKKRPKNARELAQRLERVRAGTKLPGSPNRNRRRWIIGVAVGVGVLLGRSLYQSLGISNRADAPNELSRIMADQKMAQVSKLLSLVPTDFTLQLTGNTTVVPGDRYRLQFISDQPCHTAIFLHDREGYSHLLHPTTDLADEARALRSADITSSLTVGESAGLEVIQAVACTDLSAFRKLIEAYRGLVWAGKGLQQADFPTIVKSMTEAETSRGPNYDAPSSAIKRSSAYLAIETSSTDSRKR